MIDRAAADPDVSVIIVHDFSRSVVTAAPPRARFRNFVAPEWSAVGYGP